VDSHRPARRLFWTVCWPVVVVVVVGGAVLLLLLLLLLGEFGAR